MIQKTCIYVLVFTGMGLIFFIAAHVMFQICDQLSVDNTPIAAKLVFHG